jgi:glutamate carboxypeptidase
MSRAPNRSPWTVLLALLASTLMSGGAMAALSETEQALVDTVDQRLEAAKQLLVTSVNVNSGTFNHAGVREVGDLFANAFETLGLTTEWVDGTAFGRAGHLVARHGDSGPHLLLIGHLDTVFEPSSPFQRYETLDGNRARGPGVIDMKGGNVVIVEALAALAAVDALDDLQITVVLTGDEETSGDPLSRARQALTDAAREADVALGFEDGDGDPTTAVIARRGYTGWQLDVTGRPAHSSLIFRDEVGYGAAFEAARILDGFREALAAEEFLTFNPGLVLAGTTVAHDTANSAGNAFGKDNVIPEHAVVSGDLRALSGEQERSARARMRAIVGKHLPGTSATIEFFEGYPPLAPTDGNRRLLARYDRASRDLGFGPVAAADPAAAGAADISFTAGLVAMALDGLGLMGTGGHTVEETADLDTLPSQTKRAALLMYRLSRDGLDP